MEIQKINTEEEFEKVIQSERMFFLLKHSLTCPISASAKAEFEQFNEGTEVPCYILHVQEARALSNKIADDYGIRHESPQALLFQDQKVVWNDSHGSITNRNLKRAID